MSIASFLTLLIFAKNEFFVSFIFSIFKFSLIFFYLRFIILYFAFLLCVYSAFVFQDSWGSSDCWLETVHLFMHAHSVIISLSNSLAVSTRFATPGFHFLQFCVFVFLPLGSSSLSCGSFRGEVLLCFQVLGIFPLRLLLIVSSVPCDRILRVSVLIRQLVL